MRFLHVVGIFNLRYIDQMRNIKELGLKTVRIVSNIYQTWNTANITTLIDIYKSLHVFYKVRWVPFDQMTID